MNNYISVAIDGPAGAGKTSTAKALAKMLGYTYVDTGLMYRAIAYSVMNGMKQPMDVDDDWLKGNINRIHIAFPESGVVEMTVDPVGSCPDYHKACDDSAFRTELIGMGASTLSKSPVVRGYLLDSQRAYSRKSNVIMEGRDIGTVVLPNADYKFFLTAELNERARRRLADLQAKDAGVDFNQVLSDLAARDKQDTERAVAPLKQADDAILVDNTNMSFEETVEYILSIISRNH